MITQQLTIGDVTFTFHDYTTAEYDQAASILQNAALTATGSQLFSSATAGNLAIDFGKSTTGSYSSYVLGGVWLDFSDVGGSKTFLYSDGTVHGLTLYRIVVHELAHAILDLEDIDSTDHLTRLDVPGADFKGETVTFTNSVLIEAGVTNVERLHYLNTDVYGTPGTNWTNGNTVANVYIGVDTDNTLIGSSQDELFFGDDGADSINAGGGSDYVYGNEGNDTLGGGLGNDKLDGGSDVDTVTYDYSTSAVEIYLANGGATVSGGGDTDTFSNIENAIGSDYNDKIIGNADANTLFGGDGDDVLGGGGGIDVLDGGGDEDTVSYDYLSTLGVNVNLLAGTAYIDVSDHDTLSNIEVVIGSTQADTLTGSEDGDQLWGSGGNDELYGSAGDDNLVGGAGADEIFGGDDDDTLEGGDNNDSLTGGNGDDKLDGGAGSDTLTGGEGSDLLEGGEGNDSIVSSTGDTVLFSGSGYGNDTVTGGGHIKIGNTVLRGEAEGGNGTYTLGGLTLTGDPDETGLLISDGSGNSVHLTEWVNGNNGIKLPADANEGGAKIEARGLLTQAANAPYRVDPIVVDLDSDGIELIASENGAYFDLTGDGTIEHVGWIAPDEGLVVLDRNGNGFIDDISELFGNADLDGFEHLAQEEAANGANSDRIINVADTPLFEKLQIWQDLNSDGFVQTGELSTLAEHNITSLDIRSESIQADNRWVAGNQIIGVSSFTRGDGSTGEVAEVLFGLEGETDFINSSGVYNGTDAALLALPQSRGFGSLESWQDAMGTNTTLRTLIENFANRTTYSGINGDVKSILYEWGGVSSLGENSRGYEFDARKLVFMEELFAENFVGAGGSANPADNEAVVLSQAWNVLFKDFKSLLLIQGPLQDIFPNADYNFVTDTLDLNDTLPTILDRIDTSAFADNPAFLLDVRAILLTHKEELAVSGGDIDQEMATLLADALGDAGLTTALIATFDAETVVDSTSKYLWDPEFGEYKDAYVGSFRNDLIIADNSNTISVGDSGADLIIGGTGNDTLFAGADWATPSDHDTLFGGLGNDKFHLVGDSLLAIGGAGDDWFVGSTLSNSTVDGGDGNDRFGGGLGGTNSTLYGGSGDDTVTAGSFNASLMHYLIDLGDGNDTLSSNYLWNATILGGAGDDSITAVQSYIDGGEGNDFISVSQDNSTVYGGIGNDSITSSSNSHLLYGGDGHDTITGGGGNDTIAAGEGNDRITVYGLVNVDAGGGDDTVTITSSVSAGNSSITLGGGKNTLAQSGTISVQASANMTIAAGDEGDLITYTRSKATVIGGLGDDTITSGTGADSVEAGDGNDTINVSSGNDTVNGGAGNDTITSGSGQDIVVVDAATNATDTITDFVAGQDTIDLSAVAAITGMNGLTLSDDSGNTVIGLGNGQTIRLSNVDYTTLTASDFIFAAPPPNTAPVSASDIYTAAEGDVLTVLAASGVLANDSDADNDGLTAVLVSDVAYGILTFNADGSFAYTHDGSENHSDSFSYKANDGTEDGNTVTVSLSITPMNDAPVAAADSYTVDENGILTVTVANGVLTNDSDAENDSLAAVLVSTVAYGTLTLNADGSFAYTHDGSANYSDSFTYTANDGTVDGNTVTVSFTITPPQGLVLQGTSGADSLIGSAYADSISAGNGNDTLYGGAGNDTLLGSSGNDIIYGEEGDDSITDTSGYNTLYGGAGNDTVSAVSNSIIDAGDGHDQITAWGLLNINAGMGDDIVSASSGLSGYSVVDLGAGSNRFEWNNSLNSTSASISIAGGEGADFIEVRIGSATLVGGAGDDMLISYNSGIDYIDAGDGNDTINAGNGNDTIYGGSGNDVIIQSSAAYKLIYGDDGDDQITVNTNNTVYGGTGNDTISGASNNVIDAGDGHDQITAWGLLNINAGMGDDTISASSGLSGYSVVDLGAGSNRFEWNNSFTSTSATISVAGGEGADYIEVKTGSATLVGGAGDDTLISYSGADYIDAGDGNDSVNAGNGNDTIIGGTGADVIMSGGSIDHFVYLSLGDSTDTARDVLTDFTANDYIDVSALGFTGIQSGAASGNILGFSVVGGNTIIEAAGSDFSIELIGVINLVAGDFIFE